MPPRHGQSRSFILALVSAAILSGCVVSEDYHEPDLTVPVMWNATKKRHSPSSANLATWWNQLNDPLLNDFISEAINGNLDMQTAAAKVREARASYRQQRGDLFPSVDGTASIARSKSAAVEAGTPAMISTQYQAGFDASWELDIFGGNKRAVEAARYGEQAAEEGLRDTLVTLIGDIASNYVQARQYQTLLQLAQQSAASQRKTASLTRVQLAGGEATAVDSAKADAQASSTEADIPTYRISYAEAINRLGVLLNQPSASIETRMASMRPIPSAKMDVSVGIPADILTSRPDIREAERRYAQYYAKVGQAEANRYPAISLTGDIASSAASIGDIGKNSTIGWSIGPTLSVPLFNGGKLEEALNVAKAQRDQYFIAYEASVTGAMEEVENAIVSLTQSRLKTAKLASAVVSYRNAASLSHKLQLAGAIDFFDVLDAERSLYSAELLLINSRAATVTYYITLNKALGGGWSNSADVQTASNHCCRLGSAQQ